MGRPVVHFEVTGRDGKRLQQFYAKLFDWKIDTNNPDDYGTVTTGGDHGIGGGIGAAKGPGWAGFYVDVDDLEAYLKKAEQLGGKQVGGPIQAGPVTLAWFADPEGNRIGLVKGM